MKNIKNKGTLFAILIVGILGIVGGTYAYFSSSDSFDNLFNSKSYILQAVEQFQSPEGWIPGDTTPKTVSVTNTGDIGAAVRIEVVEEWKDASNNTLPLVYDSDDHHAAIINYNPELEDTWLKAVEDGHTYYYYKAQLKSGETTTTLLNSVTFDSNITKSFNDSCNEDATTHTKICNSTATGYIGGTYTLSFNIETVQFEQYRSIWNTDVEILNRFPVQLRIISGDLNTVGSEVSIGTEHFYVFGKEDSTHVKLLAKYNLGAGTGYDVPTNRQDSEAGANSGGNGSMLFMDTPYYYESGSFKDGYADDYYNYKYVYTNAKENGVYLNKLAPYVDDYVEYINSLGFNSTGRLLGWKELDDTFDGEVPTWVKTPQFWLGTALDYSSIAASCSTCYDGVTNYNGRYNRWGGGVRPLLIMEIPTT